VGSRKRILDDGSNRPMRPCKGAICRGKDITGHVPLYSITSCAKMAAPIEMQFRLRTQVLDGIQIAPCEAAIFTGKDMHGHAR